MFSKKNKYIKYVRVYIICTDIWFICLCFYCKCSMHIGISVRSGELRYPAVRASAPSSPCCSSVSRRRAEASSERWRSSAGARCVALAWLCSCQLSGCSEPLGYRGRAASTAWASSLAPTWVRSQELRRSGSYDAAMPWNTDHSKKCVLFLFFPHHSFILAFSL